MTDLTEQLYAGNLPTGHYYFNNGVETYIVLYKNINSKHLILQEPEGIEVLCKVPSYDEWVYLHKARNDAHEIVESLTQENQQLKELLKKCREILDYAKDFAYHNPCCKCIEKINKALGEDK